MPDDWRPTSVVPAPRDGTLIDLWGCGQRWPACRWFEHDWDPEVSCWQQVNTEFPDGWVDLPRDFEPTHWMPVPEPPHA